MEHVSNLLLALISLQILGAALAWVVFYRLNKVSRRTRQVESEMKQHRGIAFMQKFNGSHSEDKKVA